MTRLRLLFVVLALSASAAAEARSGTCIPRKVGFDEVFAQHVRESKPVLIVEPIYSEPYLQVWEQRQSDGRVSKYDQRMRRRLVLVHSAWNTEARTAWLKDYAEFGYQRWHQGRQVVLAHGDTIHLSECRKNIAPLSRRRDLMTSLGPPTVTHTWDAAALRALEVEMLERFEPARGHCRGEIARLEAEAKSVRPVRELEGPMGHPHYGGVLRLVPLAAETNASVTFRIDIIQPGEADRAPFFRGVASSDPRCWLRYTFRELEPPDHREAERFALWKSPWNEPIQGLGGRLDKGVSFPGGARFSTTVERFIMPPWNPTRALASEPREAAKGPE
ncbi:MAG: hypothetical protein AAGA81_04595 [Acidobacteriota bacterium]